MMKRFSPVALLATLQDQITDYPVYDVVPKDATGTFYIMELVNTRPADTKTMYITEFVVNLHAIASGTVSVLEAIQHLEECLSDKITLPEGYYLANQLCNGVLVVKTDETGEKHAVEQWSFKVAYGYKTKGV